MNQEGIIDLYRRSIILREQYIDLASKCGHRFLGESMCPFRETLQFRSKSMCPFRETFGKIYQTEKRNGFSPKNYLSGTVRQINP